MLWIIYALWVWVFWYEAKLHGIVKGFLYSIPNTILAPLAIVVGVVAGFKIAIKSNNK